MGKLLDQDSIEAKERYRTVIKAMVADAFDRIEREQLTLRQIADRDLFPEEWCLILGYATLRRPLNREDIHVVE
jgi:hypothetical protein